MNLFRPRADPDPELTVIDLRLLARPGLEAHRRKLRPPTLIAVRPDATLHLHQTARKAQGLQLTVKHYPVEADLRRAPLDKLSEAIQLTPSPLWAPRLPPPEPDPALDRLTIDAKFARDLFNAIASFPARNHLPHQFLT
jgi:hypothetical protein